MHSIFDENSTYSSNSGGYPEAITSLSYEELI